MRNGNENGRGQGARDGRRICLGVEAIEGRVVPATLPAGFAATTLANDLISVTKIAVARDDTVFLGLQGGEIYRLSPDGQSQTLVAMVNARKFVDQGLNGMVIDPAYPEKPFAYVLATSDDGQLRNRILRVTLDGSNQESVLLEFDELSPRANAFHVGGAMAFGADGMLYVGVGDQDNPDRVQNARTLYGKVLRIAPDGSVPADNPTPGSYVYAMGFRNPFDMDVDPRSGQIFVNDVGLNKFEEINVLTPGGNYGWPGREGTGRGYRPVTVRNPIAPWYAYGHNTIYGQDGCAITGGVFTTGMTGMWPAEFANAYFYTDFCHDQIRMVDLDTRQSTVFASGLAAWPVDLAVNSKGDLYYLARGDENDRRSLMKISYAPDQPPRLLSEPESKVVPIGGDAVFRVTTAGAGPIRYDWFVNGERIEGANGPEWRWAAAGLTDSGATVEVRLTNDFGSTVSRQAILTVVDDQPPRIAVRRVGRPTPLGVRATLRLALDVRTAAGQVLEPDRYRWKVDLAHNTHTHGVVPTSPGAPEVSFRLAPHEIAAGETIRYQVTVEATVPSGLRTVAVLQIDPLVRNRRILGWRVGQLTQVA